MIAAPFDDLLQLLRRTFRTLKFVCIGVVIVAIAVKGRQAQASQTTKTTDERCFGC